jgi:hypothetical protein
MLSFDEIKKCDIQYAKILTDKIYETKEKLRDLERILEEHIESTLRVNNKNT